MSSINVAATIGTPAAKLGETKPVYIVNNCFFNAYMNQKGCYKDRKLRVVIGSLGVNDHYEFGGKEWTWKEFKAHGGGFSWDAHAWLEDSEGNIYDYIFREYDAIAKLWTGRGLKFVGRVEGGSPEKFKEVGVSYVPADKETQENIWTAMLPLIKKAEKALKEFAADDDYGCVVVSGGGGSSAKPAQAKKVGGRRR